MKIKMKTLASGPGGVLLAGQIYISPRDMSDEQARALVAGGYAEMVDVPAAVAVVVPVPVPVVEDEIETMDAPVEPIEHAVKPRSKRKS